MIYVISDKDRPPRNKCKSVSFSANWSGLITKNNPSVDNTRRLSSG
jgi:hypothetical protein